MTTTPHSKVKLLVAMELSNTKWRLAFSEPAERPVRQKVIGARNRSEFLAQVKLAKHKWDLPLDAPVVCCYEAGRDGFWIQRWLESEGIECLILDPASIEVNRKKRRAKTDRLDAQSLVRLLKRYLSGDEDVFSIVRAPSVIQEDDMRLDRELERLKKERSSHVNRIKSLLILHGLYIKGSLSRLRKQIDGLRLWNDKPLPEALKQEILRELDRGKGVSAYICTFFGLAITDTVLMLIKQDGTSGLSAFASPGRGGLLEPAERSLTVSALQFFSCCSREPLVPPKALG